MQLFSNWLDIKSLSTLDIAIACRRQRLIWLSCLRAIDSAAIKAFFHYPSSIKWLIGRNITITSIQMNPKYHVRKNQFDGLITSSVRIINFHGCPVHDGVLTSLALACPLLQHADLGECFAYDSDVMTFAEAGPRLNLSRCIRDTGLTALTENCPLLRSVDCSGIEHLTTTELAALANGCPLLKSINMRYNLLTARSRLDMLKSRCPRGSFYPAGRDSEFEV